MPYQDSRANVTQDQGQYAITDNPVFKVSVKNLATALEQRPDSKDSRDDGQINIKKKYKIGDFVKGKDTKTDKWVHGKIVEIDHDDIVIIDEENNKRKHIDKNSCQKITKPVGQQDGDDIKLNVIPKESKFITFKNFKKMNS